MVKLLERIQELKNKFEERQKQIDKILESADRMLISHSEGMDKMKEAMEEINITVNTMHTLIHDVSVDYKKIKSEITGLKNNWWLRLFGVR